MTEKKAKKTGPTKQQQRLLDKIRKAGAICREHNAQGSPWFFPGGGQGKTPA